MSFNDLTKQTLQEIKEGRAMIKHFHRAVADQLLTHKKAIGDLEARVEELEEEVKA